MIDILKAKDSFKKFISNYKETPGYNLKVVHTYNVSNNAKILSTNLKLSQEDIELAELIGLLHDIGRFEELKVMKGFDSVNFNHAEYGVKMLFEDNLIRNFIDDDSYDEIIKNAISNHSKLKIDDNLDEKSLLHSKIIRDADKLDNYRVKVEENIEEIFSGKVNSKEEVENSPISDKVYETIKEEKCIDIHDRIYPLDYWLCILAFTFDLNFKETFKIIKDNNYINRIIDRFNCTNPDSKEKINNIKTIINNYIDRNLK